MTIEQHPSSPTQTPSTHAFWKVFLLSLFFGVLGVDHFVTGKTKTGLFKLFTLGACGFWALFDVIMILVGKFKDSEGKQILNTHKGLSWGVFVVVVVISMASSESKQKGSHHSKGSQDKQHSTSVEDAVEGVYLSTSGPLRGSLALYLGGTCEVKFGNGGSTRNGNWSVENNQVRVQIPDSADMLLRISGSRTLIYNDGTLRVEYNKISN